MKNIVFIFFLTLGQMGLALDCNNPPTNGWGAGYAAYASWCSSCGGMPSNSNGVSCTPGPNWGSSDASGSDSDTGNFLLDFASGGAYSREKEMESGAKRNRLELENWSQSEKNKREQAHSRLSAQLKLGEAAAEGYSARAVNLPKTPGLMPHTGNNSFRVMKACTATAAGIIKPTQDQKVCGSLTCGGTDKTPVCCPSDYPILNECDCNCYKTSEFSCSRFANCNYYEVSK